MSVAHAFGKTTKEGGEHHMIKKNTIANGGQTLVEYALIIALVSVALIAALNALKGGISGSFSKVSAQL
jgi:Flp pilus assembly pilin Flp